MLLQLLDMLTDASVCTFYVMPYVPCWILLCKMTFFFLISILLVHISGENRKSEYTISVSPLLCSFHLFYWTWQVNKNSHWTENSRLHVFLGSICPTWKWLQKVTAHWKISTAWIHSLWLIISQLQAQITNFLNLQATRNENFFFFFFFWTVKQKQLKPCDVCLPTYLRSLLWINEFSVAKLY